MSSRGLHFIRSWVASNVDPAFANGNTAERAHILAAACRLEAKASLIGEQEIEDEVGELEQAFLRLCQGEASAIL
jgi:hypothetical protein